MNQERILVQVRLPRELLKKLDHMIVDRKTNRTIEIARGIKSLLTIYLNLKEKKRLREESKIVSGDKREGDVGGEGKDQTLPDWYTILTHIQGFNYPLEHCSAWLLRQGISENQADHAAYAVKSKWDGKTYTDPWATFQNWAKNQQRRDNGNGDSKLDPIERIRQKHIREAEKRGLMP